MYVESYQWQIGLERILILPLAPCGFDTPYLSLPPLGIATMIPCTWGLSMSDIVHSHVEHVEKKRRVLRGNTMSCRHRSMVGSMANPPHPSPYCNPRCLLYLGMMMLVISCICCLAVPTFDIIYVICLV